MALAMLLSDVQSSGSDATTLIADQKPNRPPLGLLIPEGYVVPSLPVAVSLTRYSCRSFCMLCWCWFDSFLTLILLRSCACWHSSLPGVFRLT